MSGFNLELLGGVTGVGNNSSFSRTQEIRGPQAPAVGGASEAGGAKGVTFADLLQNQIAESNNLIQEANVASEELVAGRTKDLHGAMISLEKADVSFRMLMGVRNKMLEAYREIMRMQV